MKKFISILLALCTALTLFTATVFAENEVGTEQLVVIGNFGSYNSDADWNPACEDFKMTYEPNFYILTLENMAAGTYEFKIAQFGTLEGTQYNMNGSGENLSNSQLVVEQDGSTVTFTCDLREAYCYVEGPLNQGLAVVGNFGNYNSDANWNPACEDFKMTYDSDSGIYSLTLENMTEGTYEFRIIQFGVWYGTNYNLEGSGENLASSQLVVECDGSTVVFTCDLTKAYYTVTPPAVVDTQAPVINDIHDGDTYCGGSVCFAVTDNVAVKSVTVNGTALTATDGVYSLDGFTGTLTIVATDTSSNSSSVTVTINEHSFKLGQCTECGAEDPDASAIAVVIGNVYRAIASAFNSFIAWINGIFA